MIGAGDLPAWTAGHRGGQEQLFGQPVGNAAGHAVQLAREPIYLSKEVGSKRRVETGGEGGQKSSKTRKVEHKSMMDYFKAKRDKAKKKGAGE